MNTMDKPKLWSTRSETTSGSSPIHSVDFRQSHCGKNAVAVFRIPDTDQLVCEFFWQKNRKDKSYYKCCGCDRQARQMRKQYPEVARLNVDLRRVKVIHVRGTVIVDSDPLTGHHPNCTPLTNGESLNNALRSSKNHNRGSRRQKSRPETNADFLRTSVALIQPI